MVSRTGRDAVGMERLVPVSAGGSGKPMRSRPGRRPTSCARRARREWCLGTGRRRREPAVASSTAAVSRTERVSTCSCVVMARVLAEVGPERVACP